MLFFVTVMVAVSGSSIGIEAVSIGVQVVPSGQICGFHELALVEGAVRAVGFVREAHRMLVEFGNWQHFLVISRMREVILSQERSTALVVTPQIGPCSLNPSGHFARSALGPCTPLWNQLVVELPHTFIGPKLLAVLRFCGSIYWSQTAFFLPYQSLLCVLEQGLGIFKISSFGLAFWLQARLLSARQASLFSSRYPKATLNFSSSSSFFDLMRVDLVALSRKCLELSDEDLMSYTDSCL